LNYRKIIFYEVLKLSVHQLLLSNMCVFFYENSRYSTHTLKKKARNIVQDTSSQLQLTGIEEIKQNKKTQTNREIKKT
jgi:hypothetical protein